MGFDVEEWGESNLKRFTKSAKSEWTAECPSCGKWSTFYINGDTGAFVCFSCEIRGLDATGLVALVEDLSWAEAKRYIFRSTVKLRRKSEIFTIADRIRGLRPDAERKEDESEDVCFNVPAGFKPVWNNGSWSYPTYLKDRKIKAETARKWGLGYCRFGDFANRLVIPIECPFGYSFTARAMFPGVLPKYKNPTGADHRRLLIGWNVHSNSSGTINTDICLVEGPLDAIKLDQHGIPALALGGKNLHSEQMSMLFELDPGLVVTVMLDPEELLAPLDLANQLSVHFSRLRIARLPAGIDPGDSTKSVAKAAVMSAEPFSGARGAKAWAKIVMSSRRLSDSF